MRRRELPVIGLLCVLLSILCAGSAWGGQIDPALQEEFNQLATGASVTALVYMTDQVDLQALNQTFETNRIKLDERHEIIVTELQALATSSQASLITYLNTQLSIGGVDSYETYWVSNTISVTGTQSVLETIAARADVAMVYYNYEIEGVAPTENGIPEAGGATAPETGLTAIRAPEVWALGYTGSGVLVANFDTGVEGTHDALESRWAGTADPRYAGHPEWAWFDPYTHINDFPFEGGSGHGTHTMGTICGGAPGDQIGVAPGALWIAAASIDRGGSIDVTVNDLIESFQWVIDPDGNPATNWDVPDVLSNSWGLRTIFGYSPCDDLFWSYIDACEAAGIAVVFAAGNFGTSEMVRPGDRAWNDYQTCAVAAVDGNTAGWPIASFSSRGPTYCTPTGVAAIKPEIAAPGYYVRSSVPNNQYGTKSGTSMATPHIAGVIALMREANPYLPVNDIKQIIYNTAYDLGTAGKDNDYGYGMVDAYEAVQQALALLPDDTDGDGIFDDGDFSGTVGDNPCTAGATNNCDDNCLNVPNPYQEDSDGDGIGDACDGYVVRNVPGQYPNIQAAINAAQNGDHVVVGIGTFYGPGNVNVDFLGKEITVRSVLGPDYTTIDCGGIGSQNRGFVFVNDETSSSVLQGFTIQNGDARGRPDYELYKSDEHGGAIRIRSASPTIINCRLKNNYGHIGGAIHCMKVVGEPDNVYPTFINCVFEGNVANHPTLQQDNGGAIMFINSHPTFTNCQFIDNDANEYGGAVYAMTSTGTFTNCTFDGNQSAYVHGGAVLGSASDLDFNQCIISNTPAGYGISIWNGSVVDFNCGDFWNNTPSNYSSNSSTMNVDANTIFEDPIYCDPANNDFTLYDVSPCLAENSPCELTIGALGAGCESPVLANVIPQSYVVGAVPTMEVIVMADQPMDPTSFNSNTFKVFSRTSGRESGTYNYATSPYWYWFEPDGNYRAGEIINYVLTTGVTDATGHQIRSPYVGTFMVRASTESYGYLGNHTFLTTGNKPDGAFPADLDGDGDIDLAIPNHDSHSISLFMNNGNGTFASQVTIAAGGNNPWDVTARDFDSDGDIDLATSNYGTNDVSVYLNNGSGSFTVSASYTAGTRPHPILSEDIDGDGDFDLIAANLLSDDISVYFNNGDGTFTAQTNFYVGDGPIGLAGADYDRDGDIDIFTANYYSSTIGMLVNNGDGTFEEAVQLPMGASGPFNVIAIDLSGDGLVDLATANRGSDDVSVLLQDYYHNFSVSGVYDAGIDPYYVCGVDLNGDNRLELVSANLNSDDISVFTNNGSGVFGTQTRYPAGDGPLWVCAADFNADQMMDIAVANAFNNTVSVYYNTEPGPALTSPSNGYSTTSHTITLNWEDYSGAITYEVVVDADPAFGSIDRQMTGLTVSQWLISPTLGHGTYYWKVRAQTAGGPSNWSQTWRFTIRDIPTSCPVLFTHDGADFIKDNPLLTACEASGYTDIVTDYYHVAQPVVADNGTVTFQLREMEDEITYLYDLELMVADHGTDSRIACSPTGEISTYLSTLVPISAIDNEGRNQLEAIVSNDGVKFEATGSGYLDLVFETGTDEPLAGGIIIDAPPKQVCPWPDPEENGGLTKAAPTTDAPAENVDVTVSYQTSEGEWRQLPSLPPRAMIGSEALPTPIESNTLTIRVAWDGSYSTDIIQYFVTGADEPTVTTHRITDGNITLDKVSGQWTGFRDGEPIVLRKGDVFEFTFAVGDEAQEGLARDYIIRAVGRYQPDYTVFASYRPAQPQLHGNFPNPFNPTTTISYDLSVDGAVKLEVFNVLGQQVRELVNANQPAGSYTVTWDSRDNNNQPVSSGIYFYRLTTADFTQSKKMLLLK